MLTENQKQSFHDNGYLVIPNVLSAQEVEFLRSRITGIFESDEWKKSPFNTERVLASVYDAFPEFIEISLKSEVIEVLSEILGSKPVLFPETSIHSKFYTGWHKDTTNLEREGERFHWDKDCLLVQCGFYLQDNDEMWGGGLTVMQGSHNTADYFVKGGHEESNLLDKIKRKLGVYKEENDLGINPNRHKIIDVPSKVGDFVIFNMRTNHRATLPKKGSIDDVPKNFSKIALFNAFSRDNEHARAYFNYISNRPEPFYQNLKSRDIPVLLRTHADKLGFNLC